MRGPQEGVERPQPSGRETRRCGRDHSYPTPGHGRRTALPQGDHGPRIVRTYRHPQARPQVRPHADHTPVAEAARPPGKKQPTARFPRPPSGDRGNLDQADSAFAQMSRVRSSHHLMILVTRPEPTVRPPSRMAKPRPSSMAMGWMSWTVISVVSPGMTISVPSGRVMTPVTSVVRK